MAWSSQKCNVLTSLTVESNASVLLEALALVASPYQRAVVFAHLCALQICELHSKILNSPTSLRLQTTDFLCIISLNDRATSIVSTASALVKDIAIVGRILEVCFGDAGFGGCICEQLCGLNRDHSLRYQCTERHFPIDSQATFSPVSVSRKLNRVPYTLTLSQYSC